MTTTPNTSIRMWVKEHLDNNADPFSLANAAVDHFLADEDFVESLISSIVRREASAVIRQSGALIVALEKNEPSPVKPTLLPVPQAKTSIVIDMARMRKGDLIQWAQQKRDHGDAEYRDAAFLLQVAGTLAPDEKVADRYTVDDLSRIRGKITVQGDHRVYIGQNSHSFNALLPGRK